MPTYDWKCEDCGCVYEGAAPMSRTESPCPLCEGGQGVRLFSPNRNILIPGHFRMDRGWHLPPEGSAATSPDANSRVHARPRETFKQQFDKNWKTAGGG